MIEPGSDFKATVRGLLWVALLVLIFVLVRAGRHHLLTASWWRPW
jgi:hypothetical protein